MWFFRKSWLTAGAGYSFCHVLVNLERIKQKTNCISHRLFRLDSDPPSTGSESTHSSWLAWISVVISKNIVSHKRKDMNNTFYLFLSLSHQSDACQFKIMLKIDLRIIGLLHATLFNLNQQRGELLKVISFNNFCYYKILNITSFR